MTLGPVRTVCSLEPCHYKALWSVKGQKGWMFLSVFGLAQILHKGLARKVGEKELAMAFLALYQYLVS